MQYISSATEANTHITSNAAEDGLLLDSYSRTVVNVAKRASDAVVHLKVHTKNQRQNQQQPGQGTGSGFIISSDGLVVTNSHVIHGAERIEATLQDGRTFSGQVVGDDQRHL